MFNVILSDLVQYSKLYIKTAAFWKWVLFSCSGGTYCVGRRDKASLIPSTVGTSSEDTNRTNLTNDVVLHNN
jgi:hypothetical protein